MGTAAAHCAGARSLAAAAAAASRSLPPCRWFAAASLAPLADSLAIRIFADMWWAAAAQRAAWAGRRRLRGFRPPGRCAASPPPPLAAPPATAMWPATGTATAGTSRRSTQARLAGLAARRPRSRGQAAALPSSCFLFAACTRQARCLLRLLACTCSTGGVSHLLACSLNGVA